MATHNYVSLYGVVRRNALVKSTTLSRMAACPVTVIKGVRNAALYRTDYHTIKYSSPVIMTEEDMLVDEMATWIENDVVYVVGFLATREVQKAAVCPGCQKENLRIEACPNARSGGNQVYVKPIYLEKVHSYPTQDFAHKDVIKHAEVSNRVFLIGNLTSDPVKGSTVDTHEDETAKEYCRYQLAINRKYCATGMQDIMERTDYPWVYSYDEYAKRDYAALRKGSRVFIDGALQTRKYKEEYICPYCGKRFLNPGRTLEVLSYATEYLSDFDTESLRKVEGQAE